MLNHMLNHGFGAEVLSTEVDLLEVIVPANSTSAVFYKFYMLLVGGLPYCAILIVCPIKHLFLIDKAAEKIQIITDETHQQLIHCTDEL